MAPNDMAPKEPLDGAARAARRIDGNGDGFLTGEYRLDMVTTWLADPDGGPGWGFIFSGTGEEWYEVACAAETTIDPVGKPRMGIYGMEADGIAAPGEDATFRPWFTNEDGLHLTIAFRSD